MLVGAPAADVRTNTHTHAKEELILELIDALQLMKKGGGGPGKGWGEGGMQKEQPLERKAKTHICATTGRGRKCPRGEITGARGGKYAGFLGGVCPSLPRHVTSESRPLTSACHGLPKLCADFTRDRQAQAAEIAGIRNLLRTGPLHVCALLGERHDRGDTHARTHARASMTEGSKRRAPARLRPLAVHGAGLERCTRGCEVMWRGETRRTSNSRDVKGKKPETVV